MFDPKSINYTKVLHTAEIGIDLPYHLHIPHLLHSLAIAQAWQTVAYRCLEYNSVVSSLVYRCERCYILAWLVLAAALETLK
jgi:hypothetical protein